MNLRERKYLLLGIFSTICILMFLILTFLFSDFFLKYSGIITFYSLIAIFVTFSITEYFKKKDKNKEDFDLLRTLFHVSNLIKEDLDYYITNLGQGIIPPTTLGSFEIAGGLPLEVKSIPTKNLDKLIIFANSKIETINEWKEGYLEILFEPDKKFREKSLIRFQEVWGDNINKAIADLKNSLEGIKSELSKWIKTEL